MAIRHENDSAWEDIEELRILGEISAYQTADHANAEVDGAWEEVWSSGIPFTKTAASGSETSPYNSITYAPCGSYADFDMSVTTPAPSGSSTGYIEISGEVNIPAGTSYEVSFDFNTAHSGFSVYVYAYDSNGDVIDHQSFYNLNAGAHPITYSGYSSIKVTKTIMLKAEYVGYSFECTGSFANLVIAGEKCKFV